MSKLANLLRRIARSEPAPLGFAAMAGRTKNPEMLIAVAVQDLDQAAAEASNFFFFFFFWSTRSYVLLRQPRRGHHQGDPAGRRHGPARMADQRRQRRETVADAERRIPAFLAHRDRAVTVRLPGAGVRYAGLVLGRAEVVQGLMPGADPAATRTNVPGVVSVFVFPDQPVAVGNGPVATLAQLKEVFAYLRQRILIGTQLFVLSAEPLPIYAGVNVQVLNGADT